MNLRRAVPWAIFGMTIVVAGITVTLQILAADHGDPIWWAALIVLGAGVSATAGLVLSTRCPDNPMGFLLAANGLVLVLNGVATNLAAYTVLTEPGALPGGRFAVLIDDAAWPSLFVFVVAIAYLFPDGTLPSARWRPIVRISVVSFAVLSVVLLLLPEEFPAPYEDVTTPLPTIPAIVGFPLLMVSMLGVLASLVGGALAIRSRYKASSGLERQQTKLLAYASLAIPATMIACIAQGAIAGTNEEAAVVGLLAIELGIPIAVSVAVLRYRLYEIDRIVNRTLVYIALSVSLVAIYAAVALGLGVTLGGGSTIPTAAATLAVAAAFGLLRRRIQSLVDRRFNRARYEGLKTVDTFLTDLRAGRAAPERTGDMLAEALHDPSLELYFRIEGAAGLVDSAGRPVRISRRDDRAQTPVRRGALPLGTILHTPSLSEQPDTLASVIAAAGLAIEIARLRVEVSRRLEEVSESRARIVAVGYEERRRLERDLHDGAQQRLVSIGLNLRHLQGRLEPDETELRAGLDGTVTELTDAIDELRELARGVRPACLDDGLAPALRELASRSAIPATIESSTDERFGEPIEAAAYFVASEALANSAKHAKASRVQMRAVRRNGTLVLSVTDDGVGGASQAEDSGLSGIADRITALGGSLEVSSPTGVGTTVTAELPCA